MPYCFFFARVAEQTVLWIINETNRQTNKQTDRQTK